MKNLLSLQKVLKDEVKELLNSKTTKEWEHNLEKLLEKASTNSFVLNSLSFVLNTQSASKILFSSTLEKLWKNLQLPNKKDQEKTLYLMHEMQFKIHQLEKELKQQRIKTQMAQQIRKQDVPNITDNHISVLKTKKTTSNLTNIV